MKEYLIVKFPLEKARLIISSYENCGISNPVLDNYFNFLKEVMKSKEQKPSKDGYRDSPKPHA